MFGYATANHRELTPEQKQRYGSVYCGICRQIGLRSAPSARVCLSYDMVFLALLLMSLYEPEEQTGKTACALHPIKARPWIDDPYIRYAADMNVALAFYNSLDDWNDDRKLSAKVLGQLLQKHYPRIRNCYLRQCMAIETCIEKLRAAEEAGEQNPDIPAGIFGELMAELLCYQQDHWAPTLRSMGFALGRFIYLMDAAMDYDKDLKQKKYNPFIASGRGKTPEQWEEYLVLAMGAATRAYEILPLVQDKALLDNILYSGVWTIYRSKQRKERNGT